MTAPETAPDYLKLYRSFDKAVSYPVTSIEGTLPRSLTGTFLRNGPGLQRLGNDELNLLDGYALVAGLSFHEGKAVFRARPVESEAYQQEKQAGRQTRRHVFTNLPSRWKNLLNVNIANSAAHDVYEWGGRVYASDAPGHYALKGDTLETIGLDQVFGIHRPPAQICPMPRWDAARNRLIFYTTAPKPTGPTPIKFHEVDTDGTLQHSMPHELPAGAAVVHDLAISEHYYVVIQWSKIALGSLLWGARTFWDSLPYDAEGTTVVSLLPRTSAGGLTPVHVQLPQHFIFHIFNAFERNGKAVIDVTRYPGQHKPNFGATYPPALRAKTGQTLPREGEGPQPHRITIDLNRGALESIGILSPTLMEAPAINPLFHGRPHRYGYAATAKVSRAPDAVTYFFFDAVAKVDFETGVPQIWSAGPRGFCSPPAFVPKPDPKSEDDGWLLTWVYDASADLTKVAVLDALDIRVGPVAVLRLADALPAVSHVDFSSKVLFR